jgi:hypothetical protein
LGEFPYPAPHFHANPEGPDLLQFEGRLLANQLALIPHRVLMNLSRFHRDLLTVEGDLTVRRPAPWIFIRVKVAER